jgi:hypothetical protein
MNRRYKRKNTATPVTLESIQDMEIVERWKLLSILKNLHHIYNQNGETEKALRCLEFIQDVERGRY